MSSIELHQAICSGLSRNLPDDIFEQCISPRSLQHYLMTAPTGNIDIKLPELHDGPALSWEMMSLVQLLAAGLLLLFFVASAIPAYAVYWLTTQLQPSLVAYLVSPLVIPAWMISYSILLVVSKWMLIGKYQEQAVKFPSGSFISWWFVDRAMMHYWELCIGFLVNDTLILRWYYILLGAKIQKTAQIKGFIREFDLVEIGEHVVLEQNLRCRMFSTRAEGRKKGVFSIRFRPIHIEKEATIEGVLSPGVFVGQGAHVSQRTVVPEGGQVQAGSRMAGNPSVVVGQANKTPLYMFGSLKCLWLIVELYAHLGFFLAAQTVMDVIPLPTWRYSRLLYFILLLLLIQIFSLTTSIVLKWLLIGKRYPGNVEPDLLRPFKDWAADYHFRLSATILFSIWSNSRMWNCILMLYGMDIDFWSKVGAVSFPPSQVDLVSIRNSFVSKAAFQVESSGAYQKTVIEESSIGYDALIGPGVHVMQTIIPPIKYVQKDVVGSRSSRLSRSKKMQVLLSSLQVEVFYLLFWVLLFASMLPVCELAMSGSEMPPKYYAPFGILLCLVQLFSSHLVLLLIQLLTYGMSKKDRPWCTSLYAVYITANWALQTWSFLPLLWGTSWFNGVIQLLGARFIGSGGGQQRVLFFGEFYDPPYLKFVNDVVLDAGHMAGHYMTFSEMRLGTCKATGVVNAHSYLSCASIDGLDQTNESTQFFVRVGGGSNGSRSSTNHDDPTILCMSTAPPEEDEN